MIETYSILKPVILLIGWSLIIWVWMYLTRIPAMKAAGMRPDPNIPRGEQLATLPAHVRWKADNYNHLMEQPTIFYALAISLAILGENSSIAIMCAWLYFGIRVIHSLVQALWNKIEVRFLLFLLSNIPLFALTFIAAKKLFG